MKTETEGRETWTLAGKKQSTLRAEVEAMDTEEAPPGCDSCHPVGPQDAHPCVHDSLETGLNYACTVVADGDEHGALGSPGNACGDADRASLETVSNAPEASEVTVGDCHMTASARALQDVGNVLSEDAVDTNDEADGRVLQDDVFDDEKLRMNEHAVGAKQEENNAERINLKRSRSSCFNNMPSVQVIYNCLTRESKEKLKELLKQWAEWHSTSVGFDKESCKDSLECGDEMYFPALQVGGGQKTVAFWMDRPSQRARLDGATTTTKDRERAVPLYDRAGIGVLIGGETEENIEVNFSHGHEGFRCFNCGSYSHSLNKCPRPRDITAVNNARKQMADKRGQNTSRYYQHSPGGKFDDLKPGILGSEVRKLLGIGELDPPPWLNRMRELGYPPGYLEDQDEPSGITIFGIDEDDVGGDGAGKDGEDIDNKHRPSRKDMVVDFPGVNTPIPDGADKRDWGSPAAWNSYHHEKSVHNMLSSGVNLLYQMNDDLDGPPGTTPQDSQHIDSGMEGVSPQQSNSWSPYLSRSPFGTSPPDKLHNLPRLGASYPDSRYSHIHNVRPFQFSSPLGQRPPYYGNDGFDPRIRAWALAHEALQSMHDGGRHSPSARH